MKDEKIKEEIKLTDDQSQAMEKIKDWWYNKKNKQTFVLNGYAGTGKTFLIKEIVKELKLNKELDVAFIAPTGKAASVLIEKGIPATTLHKLIYIVIDERADGSPKFRRKDSLSNDLKLIILDEFSMISEKTFKDLTSFGIRVICCGDPGQLSPVSGSNKLIQKPDALLSEIVRQEKGNPIIEIATKARKGEKLQIGDYGKVKIRKKYGLSNDEIFELMKEYDITICGLNATRKKLNNLFREKSGIDIIKNPFPLNNEKVLSCSNDWSIILGYIYNIELNFVNGLTGTSNEDSKYLSNSIGLISFKPNVKSGHEYEPQSIFFDTGVFTSDSYAHKSNDELSLIDKSIIYPFNIEERMKDPFIPDEEREMLMSTFRNASDVQYYFVNRIEFGYAVSCHKSQGSEFNKVLIIDESRYFKEDSNKWLYTAITRGKEEILILK